MWIFRQRTGKLTHPDGITAVGYSGLGEGKNNPSMQEVQAVGPTPRGAYRVEAPHDTESHGPYVLALTPYADNEMFGRSGFLIHGDSIQKPGTASKGCVILPRVVRELIWGSGDHDFVVL